MFILIVKIDFINNKKKKLHFFLLKFLLNFYCLLLFVIATTGIGGVLITIVGTNVIIQYKISWQLQRNGCVSADFYYIFILAAI